MTLGSRRAHDDREGGFTLIEMVVAMALAAFAFSAVAAVMFGAMRVVAVQKARNDGNEFATQAIEDLQRLTYNKLGLCAAPPGSAPSGMSDTVLLTNCGGSPAPTPHAPCSGIAASSNSIPDESYTCTSARRITYNVKRYVAYGDVAHTEKRLAVFVTWTDRGGNHEVSEQSSLRIPSQSALVGASPPSLVDAGTSVAPQGNPNVTLDGAGRNTNAIVLTAQTSGLVATDSVVATFQVLEAGAVRQGSATLTASSATSWTGTIAANSYTFGSGTQFFTFSAIRSSDGKVGSLVKTPAVTFAASVPPATPGSISINTVPGTVDIDAAGDLVSAFDVSVNTTNFTTGDQVLLVMQTLTGAVTTAMTPDAHSCLVGACSTVWRAHIDPASNYHFAAAPSPGRPLYFVAAQQVGPNAVEVGSTASVASSGVVFS